MLRVITHVTMYTYLVTQVNGNMLVTILLVMFLRVYESQCKSVYDYGNISPLRGSRKWLEKAYSWKAVFNYQFSLNFNINSFKFKHFKEEMKKLKGKNGELLLVLVDTTQNATECF